MRRDEERQKQVNKGKIVDGFLCVAAAIVVICIAFTKFDFINLENSKDLNQEGHYKEASEENSSSEKGTFSCSVGDAKEQSVLIEGVKITLKNKSGEGVAINSDTKGEVSILVNPGIYDIVFEKEGYELSILKDIEIKSQDIVYKKVLLVKENDITMEQFKNSYLDICTDYCIIRDIYSCPYIGDSENPIYTKLSKDEFQVKYDKLAFIYRCDGEISSLIKYINKNNPPEYQVSTDQESLWELSFQAHDWYNSWKE